MSKVKTWDIEKCLDINTCENKCEPEYNNKLSSKITWYNPNIKTTCNHKSKEKLN